MLIFSDLCLYKGKGEKKINNNIKYQIWNVPKKFHKL